MSVLNQKINNILATMKAKNNTCWFDDDRNIIFKEVAEFTGIDTMIFEQLRECVIQTTPSGLITLKKYL
jgi:hypothetical protein